MATVSLTAVSKVYSDGTAAVRGIDLDIDDGEFMILVGPSGCGKSTLLRMIAGLEDITSGELRIGERVVNHLEPKARDIAMVFQNYALYPHMTVRQNMAFSLRLSRRPKAEINDKVQRAATLLDLEQHLERKPAKLSGGQRQRVAMGRAMVRNPQVFLMDEPLSNLDAKLRVQMRVEISRLQQELHTTTVYVTHDQTEAMTLGDRVAVMQDGVIQQVATPTELYAKPVNTFVASFIGSPAMNIFRGRLENDTVILPFGSAPLNRACCELLSAHGLTNEVLVGVRPEHFEDASVVGDRHQDALLFEGSVQFTEAMGAETYAYLRHVNADPSRLMTEAAESSGVTVVAEAGEATVVRLDARTEAHKGRPLALSVDLTRLHFFDLDGLALS